MIFPLLFFVKVAQALANNSKYVAIAIAFLLWITNVIDVLITTSIAQTVNAFANLNSQTFGTTGGTTDLNSIEYIGYANSALPIAEFLVLSTLFVTAWVTVISIRWLKSFIPTVAN